MIVIHSFKVVFLVEELSFPGVEVLVGFYVFETRGSVLAGAAVAARTAQFVAVPDAHPDHVLLVPVGANGHDLFVDQSQELVLELSKGWDTFVEQLPICMCSVPFSDLVLHSMPTIFDLKKNFMLSRYLSLIQVSTCAGSFLPFTGEFSVLFVTMSSQMVCNFPSEFLQTHLKVICSLLGSQQNNSFCSSSLPLTFSNSSLLQCLKLLLPMKASWMELFCSVMNLRMDMDMLFSLELEPRLCSLMWRVQIIDLRSLILSYFCLIQTRRRAISSCMFLISFAFFLSYSLSYRKRWLVSFSRFSTMSFSSSWVSMMRSSSPLDFSALDMKLQQSVIVLNSNSISLMSFWRAIIMSLIFSYVLAFSFSTVRLIRMGMSQGLLQEMNFSSSLCTLSASISLFLRSRASSISSRIFSGGEPRGTYFSASWLKYTLSLTLKLSASDIDCPLRKEVSLDEEEQVLVLPCQVLSLLPIGFFFLRLFFQPYSPPAQLRLTPMPSIQKVASRSSSSLSILPFIGLQEECYYDCFGKWRWVGLGGAG